MAIVYSTLAKTNRMIAVRDLIDAAAGDGVLEIGTTGMSTVIARFALNAVCGTVSGTTLTFSGFPKTGMSPSVAGTAASARIVDGAGTAVVTGLTVGLSGADINLDSVVIATNQSVSISNASIVHV